MLLYSVSSRDSSDDLYQLLDRRYQLIRGGPITDLMQGPGYILLEEKLSKFIESLKLSDVAFHDAVIFNRGRNQDFRTHKALATSNHLELAEVPSREIGHPYLCIVGDSHLFVSGSLKEQLENEGFKSLNFAVGLSEFV